MKKVKNSKSNNQTISINNDFCYISKDNRVVDLENTANFKKRLLSSTGTDGLNRIHDFVNSIYNDLGLKSSSWKRKQKIDALDCIISNVIDAMKKKKVVKLSLNKNHYKMSKRNNIKHFTYRIIKAALDSLVDAGFIEMKLGYSDKDSQNSKMTRIWATDKLIFKLDIQSSAISTTTEFMEYYITVGENMPYVSSISTSNKKYDDPIILKSSKILTEDGNTYADVISFDETKDTIKMRKMLLDYNEMMKYNHILLPNEEYVNQHMDEDTIVIAYNLIKKISNSLYIIDNIHNSGMVIKDDKYDGINKYRYVDGIGNSIRYNRAITKYNMPNLHGFTELSPYLHRIFANGSFNYGGRFFGADYQLYDSATRSKMLINGNPVIELDYKSLHPNMMYNMNNETYEGDPYDLYDSNPILRKAVKYMFNIAINSSSAKGAYSAFKTKFSYPKKEERKLIKAEIEKYNLRPKEILSKIIDTHPLFGKYLNSGMGLTFQNIDSKIAAEILQHFVNRKIPCLCVHDSFIVERKHRIELYEVMNDTYKKYFNGYECGIDAKIYDYTSISEE